MSTVNPVNLPAAPQSTNQATANQDAFGKDAFMKLLVEQMRHQSPTDPSDGQAWINQMTQFSMLEQITNLVAQERAVSQQLNQSSAVSLIGRSVTYQDAGGSVIYGGTPLGPPPRSHPIP